QSRVRLPTAPMLLDGSSTGTEATPAVHVITGSANASEPVQQKARSPAVAKIEIVLLNCAPPRTYTHLSISEVGGLRHRMNMRCGPGRYRAKRLFHMWGKTGNGGFCRKATETAARPKSMNPMNFGSGVATAAVKTPVDAPVIVKGPWLVGISSNPL